MFFEQSVIWYWLIMRFFLGFLSFLRYRSQNLTAKIDRAFDQGMISKKGGDMKEKFELWLISLNCEGINSLGINEIVSRVDEELRIVRANEQERIVLEELIAEFKC